MASGPTTTALRQLHALLAPPGAEQPPDQDLLERFLARRDEAAFTALVRRHGAMVLGVGRRLLHDSHSAEDVFQATFLILARNAASIRRRQSLGSWLYGVAYRVAVRARSAAASRRRREQRAPLPGPTDPVTEVTWRELGAVLDEELGRLPERFRAPLVLCFLEGQSQDEAARELGCCKSTLRRRLGHGRELLRRRLLRRGVALSGGLLAAALSQRPAGAVPAALVAGTVRAGLLPQSGPAVSAEVVALVEGIGRAASVNRLTPTAALVLAVVLLGTGVGLLTQNPAADQPALPGPVQSQQAAARPAAPPTAEPPDEPRDPLVRQLNHQGFVRVVAFAPDGKLLMSGGSEGRAIRLWDVATGKELVHIQAEQILTGMALSSDGTTIATGEVDGTVRLWQTATGKPLATFRGHTNRVWGLAFAPDGKTLATGSADHLVFLWDVATGRRLHELREHQSEVWCVAFAPDGKTVAAGGRAPGATVHLWDVATGKVQRPLQGQQPEVWTLAFSPDGKVLAAGCGREAPSLRLWDVATRKVVWKTGAPGENTAPIAFSPDSRLLASGRLNGDLCLWEVITGKEFGRVPAHPGGTYGTYAVSFAPDGRTLASGGEDGFVRLWDVRRLAPGTPAPKGKLTPADLEALWDDLAAADPARGYQAVWALAAAPRQALPLCRDRLLRPSVPDPQLPRRVARLIADLDADQYEVREKATLELIKLGSAAGPAVRRALDHPASLEARRRLERVLVPLQGPAGDVLQGVRAVAVLEQVSTPQAVKGLNEVARGAAEAWLRQEARAAVDRLAHRPAARP